MNDVVNYIDKWFICVNESAIDFYTIFELWCHVSLRAAEAMAMPFVIVIFFERIKSVWQYFMNL